MASWIVHLRLAQALNQGLKHLNLDKTAFYLGNIAIDSGKVNEDLSIVPPVTISHWTPSGKRNECRYDDFFHTFCLKKNNLFEFSFYLGCVAHLLTDNYWVDDVLAPVKMKYAEDFKTNDRFILKVKKDWYDLDFLYLKNHPEFEPIKILNEIHDFKNIYLPWFDEDAIQIKIDELIAFYQAMPNDLNREYPFLNENEMNDFVSCAQHKILNEIHQLLKG